MKKELTTLLKTQLSNLRDDSNAVIFANVDTIFLEIPTSYPSLELIFNGGTVGLEGNDFDNRQYKYKLSVYEQIESSTSDIDKARRIDRLQDIEDYLLKYLEKVPNNIGMLGNMRLHSIEITNIDHPMIATETGIGLFLIIDFQLNSHIYVKDL